MVLIRKIIPFVILILSFLILLIFWDDIKLTYNYQNNIFGDYKSKQFNHLNDPLRFLILNFVPLIIFFIFFVILGNNNYSINYKDPNFFLKKIDYENNKIDLKPYLWFIFLLVFIDFLCFDFKRYFKPIDYFHEGTFLTPPINQYFKKSLWTSNLYDYGFIANNFANIVWSIIGVETIGSYRFFILCLMLLNKYLLVIIAYYLVNNLNFKKEYKKYFFIILAFGLINLVRYKYYSFSFFPFRHFLSLFFILFSILVIYEKKVIFTIALGFFSPLSMFWFLDIGLYINVLIFFIVIYFLLAKEKRNFLIFISSILISWIIVFVIFPINELKEAFWQINFIYSVSPYLLGLEYIKPFTKGLFDWYSKPSIFFIISGVMIIFLNFNRALKVQLNTKLIINFLFLCSIVFFQSALMRSSGKHIIYSSGTILFVFYYCFLYLFFYFIQKNNILNKIFYKIENIKFGSHFIILFLAIFLVFRFDFGKFNNINNFNSDVSNLLFNPDEFYLEENYKEFVNYYGNLTKEDSCIQSIYDDVSLPYLLKKPTCTKFFISAHIINNFSDEKFLKDFKKNIPLYVLYDGPYNFLTDKINMKIVEKYIKDNYQFYKVFNGWIIYKLKKDE